MANTSQIKNKQIVFITKGVDYKHIPYAIFFICFNIPMLRHNTIILEPANATVTTTVAYR